MHGFESKDFHSRCDNIPNTLTIVKSTCKCVFGGFTSLCWNKPNGLDESSSNEENDRQELLNTVDPHAFIFSLVNEFRKPLLMKAKSNHASIVRDSSSGITHSRITLRTEVLSQALSIE